MDNGGNIDDEPEDMIQAHFDKVNRTKNKFRCVLSDVMIHINGKDYILKKMTADIEYWYKQLVNRMIDVLIG